MKNPNTIRSSLCQLRQLLRWLQFLSLQVSASISMAGQDYIPVAPMAPQEGLGYGARRFDVNGVQISDEDDEGLEEIDKDPIEAADKDPSEKCGLGPPGNERARNGSLSAHGFGASGFPSSFSAGAVSQSSSSGGFALQRESEAAGAHHVQGVEAVRDGSSSRWSCRLVYLFLFFVTD